MKIYPVSGRVYRGPRPETKEDFQLLKDYGIRTILNLETGWFDFFHQNNLQETAMARSLGISTFHFKLGNVLPPSAYEIHSAVNVLIFPHTQEVYVHCLHGVDRTGIVCAAYRVLVQKWKIERAIEEMFDRGFHIFPYVPLGWVKTLRSVCHGNR